jgi:protein SCO1/2
MTRSLALTAFLVLAAGCARPGGTTTTTTAAATATAVASAGDSSEQPYTVYDLAATWRDQQGRERTLASLAGRPRVVAMIYTSCTTTCPLTVGEMKRVEREAGSADVGFVLVTLDPGHDGIARLAAFARDRALSPDRWTLLTGSDDSVRELAAALGVRYRRVSAAELAHSNTLTVLDASGAVTYQSAGLGGAGETLAAVRALTH